MDDIFTTIVELQRQGRTAVLVTVVAKQGHVPLDPPARMLVDCRPELVQRVAAIEQMSAALAHETSQPLGAILRNIEATELLLQNETTDLDEIRAVIADVKLDARRAASVIERLGSLMKRKEFAVEALPITNLIKSTAELLRAVVETRHATLHVDIQPRLPWISGDRIHLQQVLLNLMMNGLEAMDRVPPRAKTPRREGIPAAARNRRGRGDRPGAWNTPCRAAKPFRAVPYYEGDGPRDRARDLADDPRTA